MKLIVRKREVYGRVVYYPVNREAWALAGIAGTKTLTEAALHIAVEGFDAEIEIEGDKFIRKST